MKPPVSCSPRALFILTTLLTCVLFSSHSSSAQTQVFLDNFNRSSLTTGAPTTYSTTISAGDGGASINGSSFLEITNDASGAANANGFTYVSGLMSSYLAPFSSTLNTNTGVIEWTFNFRFNRTTNPAGFAAGAYGPAIILGSTSASFGTAGNGYAVVYGNTSTPDPIRLIRFTGGLSAGTLTTIISSGTSDIAAVNNYVSVRVTYNPTGDNWSLYVRDDGASAWSDPSTGVTSQKGSTTSDATYTGSSLSNFGFYWSYSTAAAQTDQFDNFKVTTTAVVLTQYRTAGSGNWNSTSTWEQSTNAGASWAAAGTTPTSSEDSIRILSGDTVTVTAAVSVDQVIVDAGGVLDNTVNALTVADGTGTDLTVDGTLITSNGIANNGLTQINGTFQINSGGFITGSPTYGSSSTLIYNTGGTYGRGDEWANTSGAGYPHHVTITNSTVLNHPNGSTAARAMGGNLTISSGSALYMDYGSPGPGSALTVEGNLTLLGSLSLGEANGRDLYLGGNWSNSGGTFTANNRAVLFQGTGTQTITNPGGESFPYLIVAKPSGNLVLNNAVTITGSAGSVLQLVNSGSIDLNSNDLMLDNDGGDILTDTGPCIISGGTVYFNGTKTVTSSSGGSLIIANAYLNDGVNFGSGLTTITSNLRVNAGGFVDTNPPTYDLNSVLTYYSGGTYGRGQEWSNINLNPGSPYHVVLNNNTQLDLGANSGSATARYVRGNLFIIIGSELTMNASGNEMTAGLYVDGDVSNDGTLTLSSLSGGDIHITGNYTQNSTYTPNGRAMIFGGAGTSTITGAGIVLDDLDADKGVALNLGSNITVNGTLNITSGTVNTGSDTLFLGPSGSLSEPGSGSIVHGNVQASRTISSTGANETFGNLGYEIEAVSVPVPGATTITRVTDVALSGEGNFSIKRSYDVSAATNTGVNLNIKFHYDDTATELNGSDESKLLLFRSPTGAAPWGEVGYTTRNTAGNYVTLNNVHQLSTWTAADSFNILGQPVVEGSDVVAVPSSESPAISSLENDSPISTVSDGAQVWQIRVRDGGIAAPDGDSFPTELIALVLNQGASNQVSDWSQAIQDASLFDGSTFITNATINPTSISFSGFSFNVPDNDSSTLSLRISLNNPLGTGVADNQHFEFALSDADVTAGSVASSSQFGTFSSISSDESQNAIDVVATQLSFSTQPQNNQITGGNIAPVSVAATDANGNTDADYGTGVTLSSGTFTLSSTDVGGLTHSPSSGVASWTNLSSSASGTGTVLANSGILSQGTSSPITVYPATVTSVANGNWSTGATWDQGSPPLTAQSAVIAHTVTLTGPSSAANVTVNSGGILDAGAFVLTASGALTLNSGSEFRQGGSVQSIPGATQSFSISSTYRFNGTQAGLANINYPQFGNLIWEPAPTTSGTFQNANGSAPFYFGIVANSMTINLQGGSPQEVYFASGNSGARTHTINSLTINNTNSVVVLSNGGVSTGAIANIFVNTITISAGKLQGLSSSPGNTATSMLTVREFFTTSGTGLCALGSGTGQYTLRLTPPAIPSSPHPFYPGTGNSFGNVWVTGLWELTGADLNIGAGYTFIDSAYFDCNNRIITGGGNVVVVPGADFVSRSAAGISASGATGDVQVTGTRTFSTGGNYQYQGTVPQQTGTGLPSSVNRLRIGNSTGVTLTSSTAVATALEIFGNILHTGPNTIELALAGSLTRFGNAHIHGNFKKHVSVLSGSGIQVWQIGDGTNYTPVTISGSSFSGNFDVTAAVIPGEHPNIGLSNIDPAKSVNRYYSLNGTYAGPYDATFTFVPGDVDGGASTSNFIVGKYNSPTWTSPTVGTKTATSTQVTGVTSFSDFAIGEQEIPSFTIDATAFPNGSINPSGSIVVNNGNDQQFTFTPNTGYHVDSVFVDGAYVDSTVSYTFYNVSASHTIAVAFAINTYTITVTQGANGVITPGTTIVTHGGSQAFTVTPNTGYHLDSMMVDGLKVDSTTSYTFVNVTANHSITALFSINTYTLNVAVVGSGTVDKAPDQLTYTHGSNVQLTPDEAFGWNFSGWSGDAGGNTNPLNVLMDGNKNITATFVEDPVYQAEYRSFSPESLAVDKDNKGKVGKYVKRKTDKVDFKFRIKAPKNSPVILNFSTLVTCVITELVTGDTIPGGVLSVPQKEFAPSSWGDSGTVYVVTGRGYKGKQIKTKYNWTVAPAVKGTVADTSYYYNVPRFPMPNRVNAMFETFEQGGFAGTLGLLVGKDRTLDSAKQYGWLLSPKYGDVLKSLYVSKTATQHTGQPRGIDKWVTTKPILKRQKSLPPTKHNNKLLAEMIALKVNISASAMSKIPLGFGELVYNDGGPNPLNGLMIKEIAAVGDSLMMGRYASGSHVFADSATFANLYATIDTINDAFEGPLDTVDFAAKLHFKGARKLIDVPYLEAGSANPAVIIPMDVPLAEAPVEFGLSQNYPNPFNPTTTIRFDLPQPAIVTLIVYNMLGQEVGTLLDKEELEDGMQEITFDAQSLASGVYFYRIVADGIADEDEGLTAQMFTSVRKMMLVK